MTSSERSNPAAASPSGLFMAGPPATGDVEGVIIHGVQGARRLTVFLVAPPKKSQITMGSKPKESEY